MEVLTATLERIRLMSSSLTRSLVRKKTNQFSVNAYHFCSSTISPKHKHIELELFYTSLLSNSTNKTHLKQMHCRLVVSGLHQNGFIVTKFINVSADIGEIRYARKVFDEFSQPYVHLWNAIIRCYSKHNLFNEAIYMYSKMLVCGVNPDSFTFPHVLKACGGNITTEKDKVGQIVHGQIIRNGLGFDGFLQNGILAFYAKCGEIGKARVLFDQLYDKTVVSWTCIISGYANDGQPIAALSFFSKMMSFDVKPDCIALVSVLKAYTDIEDIEQGKSIHGRVIKMGLDFEPDLRIGLTSMYAKCGQVMVAKRLFDEMDNKPYVIQWNAMISGYAKNGRAEDAVDLFRHMISKNIKPDDITIVSTILACSRVGSLEQAKWMNDYVKNSVYKDNGIICSALIDMYAKCGSVELAQTVFNLCPDKDVVVWSAMIVGYGLHGYGKEAIDLFHLMKKARVHPNDVTFIGLLIACNHSGLVQQGWNFFHSMKEYGIEPRHQHYACVVDLLGRNGLLDQAFEFIKTMKIEPGVTIWGALLSACKTNRHVALGEYSAKRLFELDPLNTGHYVQLSNLYASTRMWGGVAKVRALMKERGLTIDSGGSLYGE